MFFQSTYINYKNISLHLMGDFKKTEPLKLMQKKKLDLHRSHS